MEYQIPRATAERLNAPQYEGSRHAEIIKICVSLVGNQVPDSEIFAIIRKQFPPDKTDREIWNCIRWAHSKNPTPTSSSSHMTYSPPVAEHITPDQARFHVEKFLNGRMVEEETVISKSPIPIPEWEAGATSLLRSLYDPTEKINIVCRFTTPDGKPNKANPMGGGKTQTVEQWVEYFSMDGVPSSQAGCWVRPNPVKEFKGSGASGSYSDSDIESCRFLLVESDCVPLENQLSMLCFLRLPISAIIASGGNSYHAWVRLDATSDEEYTKSAERILRALAKFGIDRANKNPSRLARLPGAPRVIGGSNGGQQKLIYLNPSPTSASIL